MKAALAKLVVERSRIEVPLGCYAELAPIFMYKLSTLMHSSSGYWEVGYTELVATEAIFMLLMLTTIFVCIEGLLECSNIFGSGFSNPFRVMI